MKSALSLLLLLSLPLMFGCSAFSNNSVGKIQVVAEDKSNFNAVTTVDFVFLFKDDSIELPQNAEGWFDVHNDLRFNGRVKVVTLRIPPALISEVQMPSKHSSATKVLAYVDFQKNGDQPPIDLTQNKHPVLLLKDDHYQLSRRR
ncbi:MAG: hypothetical protein NE328_22230 [Lentisphaeraceae bacterium]|nr:hypothetical protein [Lentisphaeraceae bacterium]